MALTYAMAMTMSYEYVVYDYHLHWHFVVGIDMVVGIFILECILVYTSS